MFIVFEGLDGSGSTTQAELLTEYLIQQGQEALHTSEPTDQGVGILIRDALQKKWEASPEALQLLFTADRAYHLFTEIEPALQKNIHVICDRYIWSTIAYGSLACDTKWLTNMNANFQKPDLIFLLDVDPATCLKRIRKRGSEKELFEKQNTLGKVWKTFLLLQKMNEDSVLLDGIRSKEEIFEQVQQIVRTKLET